MARKASVVRAYRNSAAVKWSPYLVAAFQAVQRRADPPLPQAASGSSICAYGRLR
jgi:hypothetical protein